MSWTIKGQAGATLNASLRTLESLQVQSCELTLAALADDTLSWTAAASDATGAGTLVPDAGQVVEAYYNGVRRFRGHVTLPRIRGNQLLVTAAGPWWWMTRISLSSEQEDGVGASDERPSFVFKTGSLKTSLEDLIDRAIADGVPITRGSISSMFTFPRITLAAMSYAQALAALLAIVPDAVAYFDYSGSGLPALCIARRGAMAATTLDVGGDAIEFVDLSPRLDLEVKKVTIKSVSRRSSDGKTQWVSSSSGTPEVGKNQIVVISGPEVNAILPKDSFDSFRLKSFAMPEGGTALGTLPQTHSATSITGAIKDFVLSRDQALATLIREFGTSFKNNLYLSNGGAFITTTYPNGNSTTGGYKAVMDKPNLLCTTATNGFYVVSGADRVPEWATEKNGYTVKEATLTGHVRLTLAAAKAYPPWWAEAAQRASQTLEFGYAINVNSTVFHYQRTAIFPFSIPVQIIDALQTTQTTIYRRWDYDYLEPPSGLAADLKDAQNWLPWEGSLQLVADQVDGAQLLHRKYHVTGALPACATMGALAKAITYDLSRGRKTIHLGAPARTDFGTLASRFRRSPKDNINYI